MNRKAFIYEWAPILHGYGFTSRQAGRVLKCTHSYYSRALRELGVTPKPAPTFEAAVARLSDSERSKLGLVPAAY